MKQSLYDRIHFCYAGSVILIALLIGGGTRQGLWSDHLIEIILLPALLFGLAGFTTSKLPLSAKALAGCILVFLAAQFLPYSRPLPDVVGSTETSLLFTRDIGRSIESALFAAMALGYFLYLTRFSKRRLRHLLVFFLAGVLANFTVMLVQLSFNSPVQMGGVLPFTITAGLFANQNHLATLAFVTIPVLGYLLIARNRGLFVYAALIAVLVVALFAQGSRAGMGISAMLGVICLIWFSRLQPGSLLRAAQWGLMICVVLAIALLPFNPDWLDGDPRKVIFETTLEAASAYWPFGTGLGTFINIYPGFERFEDITAQYVNHAHNDYLELLLEGGVLAMMLIAAFMVLVLIRMFNSPFNSAAGIALFAVCLHSAVDYPLRTSAIVIPFAFLSAVLFAPDPERRRPRSLK